MLVRDGYIDMHGKTLKKFPRFFDMEFPRYRNPNLPLPEGAVPCRNECDFLPAVPGLEKMYWPHGHLAVANRLSVVSSRRRHELEDELEEKLAAGRAALMGEDGKPCMERIRQAYHEQVPEFNERLSELENDRKLYCRVILFLSSAALH